MATKIKDFNIEESKIINGVVIFRPSINEDQRGTLYTTYHADVYDRFIPRDLRFKHDKFSRSYKNVLRGIHGDTKSWKLVTCIFGEVLQVVVDCRKESPTYLKWQQFTINEENPISVLLPPGLGNSFFVNSDLAIYHYKLAYPGEYLDAEDQFSIKWNDPTIRIAWPTDSPILSDRDK